MPKDTDIDWVDLADDVRHEYMVVDNLRPSHGYKFRVLACNKFGWSIPSIPSPIVMTPSSGASKAEFYDALQRLQAKEDINLVRIPDIFLPEMVRGFQEFMNYLTGCRGS